MPQSKLRIRSNHYQSPLSAKIYLVRPGLSTRVGSISLVYAAQGSTTRVSGWVYSALPPDVRKVFDLPSRQLRKRGYAPNWA